MAVVTNSAEHSCLRVAVCVEGSVVRRWVRELLDAILSSEKLELVAVVARAADRPPGRRSEAAYEALDRRLFGRPEDALTPADVSELLDDKPLASALEGSGPVDVILDLAPGPAPPVPNPAPRYGVWGVRLGDGERPSSPPYFRETFDGKRLSSAAVEMLPRNGDPGHVLFRGIWATDRLSPHRNHVAASWRVGDAILGRLLGLQAHGPGYIASLPTYPGGAEDEVAASAQPSTSDLVRYVVSLSVGLVRRKAAKRLGFDQWCIAYRRRGAVPLYAGDASGFRFLLPPRDCFFADPFVMERDGRHYAFFEYYSDRTGKGVISCLELEDDLRPVPRTVLEREYHLSYPFIFSCEDETYMIPETSENRTVELYRALEFPNRWTLDTVLIEDVAAVDATLARHDGRFWMFANVVSRGRTSEDELFLFTSERLRGPWVPHPMNPVVSDVRTARPAGRILVRDGHLIRPGQDSSDGYGCAITLNRIEELSETSYREVPVARIEPKWLEGTDGTHTYNSDDDYEVLDARRRLWRRTLRRWR